jgi:hypothetical protein
MTDFEKFAYALALTESHNDPRAWGDDGVAVGRWQMHPAFVDEFWPADLEVAESWDDLFRAVLREFYGKRQALNVPLPIMVMEFHLGVRAVAEGKRDANYAARFAKFYLAEENT